MADYESQLTNGIETIKNEIGKIKNKNAKLGAIITAIALAAAAIGVFGGFLLGQNWNSVLLAVTPETVSEETVTMIEERLEKEAKLITANDTITATYNSGKIYRTILGKKIPLSSKSFSFTYTGTIEAGIKDLSATTVEVNPDEKIITLSLPEVEITNRSLNTENLNVTDQSKNFFNQITLEDFNNAQETLKDKMETQAISGGILKEAQDNAQEVLKELLSDLTEGYQLQFKWAEHTETAEVKAEK